MLRRRLILTLLIAFVSTAILTAKSWWDKKPYMEWSAEQVDKMLNDSPWVAVSLLGTLQDESPNDVYSVNWRVVLLTALPVREAYLRRLSFPGDIQAEPDFDKTVPVTAGKPKSQAEEVQDRLRRFIALYPDDIRVRGDELNVVLAISMTQRRLTAGEQLTAHVPDPVRTVGRSPRLRVNPEDWAEGVDPAQLMQVQPTDLAGYSFLSTDSGKEVRIIRYDPPGLDMLGVKLYFPRTLPDGTPLIDKRSKELRFETRINGKSLKVKFDLSKMVYKGKLEI